MKPVIHIVIQTIPVLCMLGLIYLVSNEYLLSLLFILIIVSVLCIRYEKLDFTALVLGMIGMTCGELLFIGSGVEVFTRTSLFGVMPLWLPILWGYCFVVIKRAVNILQAARV